MRPFRTFLLFLLLACAPAFAAAASTGNAAADARLAEAQQALARGDTATALRLGEEAARLGKNGVVAYNMAQLYRREGNYAQAGELLDFAVATRQPQVMFVVGCEYLGGRPGLPRNDDKGLALLQAAADAGHVDRCEAEAFRTEQQAKHDCVRSALISLGLQETMPAGTFLRITRGTGADAAGDAFVFTGGADGYPPRRVGLAAKGFSQPGYNDTGNFAYYTGGFTAHAPSADALQLAASVTAQCGVPN
jgi:hypothetical protein